MARSSIAFPALTPSSRSFSPGKYPQTVFEAQNGAKTIISYGARRTDARLNLSFTNISDLEALKIIDNYKDVNQNWNYITFDDSHGLGGIESSFLSSMIQNGDNVVCRWRYDGPPEYSSVFPGVANVSCSFVACLDGD